MEEDVLRQKEAVSGTFDTTSLELEAHGDTYLQGPTALRESDTSAHEVERCVVLVREITSPHVRRELLIFHTHVCIQQLVVWL